MTEKVYIIGKVTGEDYLTCFKKFQEREELLKSHGYRVANPMRLVPLNTGWVLAMKICLTEMLRCTYVSPLPDTWDSRGAKIEFELSQSLKMPVVIPEALGYNSIGIS